MRASCRAGTAIHLNKVGALAPTSVSNPSLPRCTTLRSPTRNTFAKALSKRARTTACQQRTTSRHNSVLSPLGLSYVSLRPELLKSYAAFALLRVSVIRGQSGFKSESCPAGIIGMRNVAGTVRVRRTSRGINAARLAIAKQREGRELVSHNDVTPSGPSVNYCPRLSRPSPIRLNSVFARLRGQLRSFPGRSELSVSCLRFFIAMG